MDRAEIMSGRAHTPVLLDAVLDGLRPRRGGIYVDGTYGRGGHSAALLSAIGDEGKLFAFDRDPQACAQAFRQHVGDDRFRIISCDFRGMEAELAAEGVAGHVDGILLDLGVSSPQLDDAERGFSFRFDGPLDMRMDPSVGESVAEWLARAQEAEISRVLRDYGEEKFHRRIAAAIVARRAESPLSTTAQLADLISDVVPAQTVGRIHPATRSFQALRIHINAELDALQQVLPQCLNLLAPGGRMAIISFHSLEDRIVKRFMRDLARPAPPPVPMAPAPVPDLKLIGGAIKANASEVAANPRARSAVLRIAEKLDAGREVKHA